MSEEDLTPSQRKRWEEIKEENPTEVLPIPQAPSGKEFKDLTTEEIKELTGVESEPEEREEEDDDDNY